MDADLKTIGEQFSDTFYQIPKFQRSYAWGEKQWNDFWRTIAERALDIETSNLNFSPLFMGAIVLQETTGETFGSKSIKNKFVIDGQQRIVTISIFMAVLRDFYFGSKTQEYYKWTDAFLRLELTRTGDETRTRLTLQNDDNDTFKKIVSEKSRDEWKSVIEGSHSLNKLYKFFWDRLSEGQAKTLELITKDDLDDDQNEFQSPMEIASEKNIKKYEILDENSIREWKSKSNLLFSPETLTNITEQQMKFAVIEIQADDNEIAFEVFETLNAKGQPLAEVDKFRNGFFMLDPDNSDENHKNYWLKMETIAGDDNTLSTFFNEEAIRRYGFTPKDKTYQLLMTKTKNRILNRSLKDKKHGRRDATISEFKDLLSSLEAFMIVNKGKDSLSSQKKTGAEYSLHLDFLKKIVSGPVTPLLIDVLKWTEKERNTDEEILKEVNSIFNSIEGLLVRRLLGGIKPQQLRSLLSNLPKKLSEEVSRKDKALNVSVENLREYRRVLNNSFLDFKPDRFPSDAWLLANPLRDVYQSIGKKLSLFSILWELERTMNPEFANKTIPGSLGKNTNSYSIEHILPQGITTNSDSSVNIEPAWLMDWNAWGVKDPESSFFKTVHAIGNLTILTTGSNSKVSNKPFAQKKESYEKLTRIMLTDDVKQCEVWTPEQIEARSIRLIELACKRWPYPKYEESTY